MGFFGNLLAPALRLVVMGVLVTLVTLVRVHFWARERKKKKEKRKQTNKTKRKKGSATSIRVTPDLANWDDVGGKCWLYSFWGNGSGGFQSLLVGGCGAKDLPNIHIDSQSPHVGQHLVGHRAVFNF